MRWLTAQAQKNTVLTSSHHYTQANYEVGYIPFRSETYKKQRTAAFTVRAEVGSYPAAWSYPPVLAEPLITVRS